MSKKITPCEKLGYKVGDKFEMVEKSYKFDAGDIVSLQEDDGTESPYFTNENVKDEYPNGVACFISSIKKVAKLKQAKQALADAIHKNGGWRHGAEYAAQDKCAQVTMFRSKPIRHGNTWLDDEGFDDVGGFGCDKIQNWHQCILSRGEYFIAYPEQVKYEVRNETQHKVEVEMKSESEMTIKIGGDWHKNGELPPVGEVCEAYIDYPPQWIEAEIVAHKDGFAIGWCKSVMKGCHGDKAHEFRPLRTERDKAIDEMVCEFIDHYGDPKGGERYIGIATKLYDAGYRKEVK